ECSLLPSCVPLCPVWLMVVLFRDFLHAPDAAKSLVAGSGIHLLRNARRRTIPQTVVGRAQVRTALQNLARDVDLRRPGIITFLFRDSFDATRAARLRPAMLLIPIAGPLPDVAGHVVETVSVRRKRPHRRSSLKSIQKQVLDRKFALPCVGH